MEEVAQALRDHLHQCQESTEIDGSLDGQRQQETEMTVVLAEEDEHGLIEHVDIAEGALLSRFALIMNNVEGQIPVLSTAFQQSEREIDILAIHKEVFVEQAYLIECLATQETVGTADHLNASRLVPREAAHIVATRKAQHFQHRHPRGRHGSARLWRGLDITVQHPHACPTRLRMLVHEVKTSLDGRFIDDGIRIEQQHVFGIRPADSLVVGTCKAHVRRIGNEMYLRMLGAQYLDGFVSRTVVNNKYVAIDAIECALHALQTFVQQLADVIADNDYADFLGHTNGIQINRMTPR